MHLPLTDPLRITAWPDEVIDRLGYQPDSAYFEWTGSEEIFELSQSVVTELARPQKSGVQHS